MLLPIKQVDQLGPIEMTSYGPGGGNETPTRIGWAIPVREDLTHVVAGGEGGTARRGGRQAVRERIGRRYRSRLRQVVGQAFRHAVGTLCDADPTPSAPVKPTPARNCDADRRRRLRRTELRHRRRQRRPRGTATASSPTGTATATPSPTGTATPTPTPDRNCDGDAGWHGPREAHTHRNGDADTDSHTGPDNDLRQTVGSRIGTAIGYPAALRASVGISERDGRPPARRRSRQSRPPSPRRPQHRPANCLRRRRPPSPPHHQQPNRLPSRRRRRPLNRSLSKPHPHPAQRRAANRREAHGTRIPGPFRGRWVRRHGGDRCPLLRPPRSRASLEILEAVESAPN